jgi:hypothetical protein
MPLQFSLMLGSTQVGYSLACQYWTRMEVTMTNKLAHCGVE